MEISVVLNAHGDTPLVTDTIEAVQKWVGSNVLVVVDGASKEWYEKDIPAHKISGFWHACPKSPYRNITLGLMEAVKSGLIQIGIAIWSMMFFLHLIESNNI